MTWLVGIAPSKPGLPALKPNGGSTSTADRLRIMLNLSVEEFLIWFPNRTNVLNKSRGAMLRPKLTGMVFVLGREAWDCLHLPRRDLWESHADAYSTFVLLPHPSGRNHVYNDEEMRRRLRECLSHS